MSIWTSLREVKAKQYLHSGYDPRKKADNDWIGLGVVADYVYREEGDGEQVLPYLRLSVGPESVVLTEKQAANLEAALHDFVERPKWRGRTTP